MKHIKAGCSSVNTCNPSVPMGKSGEGQKQDDPRSSKGSYPAIHNTKLKRDPASNKVEGGDGCLKLSSDLQLCAMTQAHTHSQVKTSKKHKHRLTPNSLGLYFYDLNHL